MSFLPSFPAFPVSSVLVVLWRAEVFECVVLRLRDDKEERSNLTGCGLHLILLLLLYHPLRCSE